MSRSGYSEQGAPPLAKSLADMIIEWVDGGLAMNTDWRPQLESVIARRLARYGVVDAALSPPSASEPTRDLDAENARLREALEQVMLQAEADLRSAHAELCKLQGLDPNKHDWPRWSPQANSLRWFKARRIKFNLAEPKSPSP